MWPPVIVAKKETRGKGCGEEGVEEKMPEGFIERLRGGPVLCDGAMGTQLYERGGVTFDRCLDELNLSNPELVKSVHLDYIRGGADLIETNTFGANRAKLAGYGLDDQVREINRRGARLARAGVKSRR